MVGKRFELQPLIGLYNDRQQRFDAPVSVRETLKSTKVDMSWMDLVAWSPAIGRELKRLCTRVVKVDIKKKKGKASANPPPPWPPHHPFTFIPPAVPVPVPASIKLDPLPLALVSGQQDRRPQQGPSSLASAVNVGVEEPDRHTRFLSTLLGVDKTFNITGTVRAGGKDVLLEKKKIPADQGSESDMNVISPGMVVKLSLPTKPLGEIGFQGLTMQTADHRESILTAFVGFDLMVEGTTRSIRCFVAPDVSGFPQSRLLLGVPWLKSVDAVISIRNSAIQIGDAQIGEAVRFITGPELVYYKDHNMLMYPKALTRGTKAYVESASESSFSESEDDLSDIDDEYEHFL